ncbi:MULTISPECIES: phycobilisome rod-core linker polypeptide [unclassified Microcoleus]|uniref:phycobilisome rod-core linker polypeptide n=1 Tax=unclassified Microcoleus TaxID=2642155 RepID=UPI0025FF80A5|nr:MULTISPECIES: phycobilisome rod-core linker polypeptide [unclassified Microcoleus]
MCVAYSQVFGNEYLMSSERVTSAKSFLLEGQISVKDFVREFLSPKLIKKVRQAENERVFRPSMKAARAVLTAVNLS